jgi:hypothetical protein
MTNQPLEGTAAPSAESGTSTQPKRKRNKAGRPSLSGSDKSGGKNSPQIAFRVNPTLRQKAQQIAEREGINVSQLGRKALKEYLANK